MQKNSYVTPGRLLSAAAPQAGVAGMHMKRGGGGWPQAGGKHRQCGRQPQPQECYRQQPPASPSALPRRVASLTLCPARLAAQLAEQLNVEAGVSGGRR